MISRMRPREAVSAADGHHAAAEALSERYAIAGLDVMLPDESGIEVLRRLRAILRRSGGADSSSSSPPVAVGALILWPSQRRAEWMGRPLDLTGGALADLGRDFDSMASRLRNLMEGQRRLLHDVSHKLLSPLARLQAAIGLAGQ